jgi:hypothetical protein
MYGRREDHPLYRAFETTSSPLCTASISPVPSLASRSVTSVLCGRQGPLSAISLEAAGKPRHQKLSLARLAYTTPPPPLADYCQFPTDEPAYVPNNKTTKIFTLLPTSRLGVFCGPCNSPKSHNRGPTSALTNRAGLRLGDWGISVALLDYKPRAPRSLGCIPPSIPQNSTEEQRATHHLNLLEHVWDVLASSAR